MQMGRRRFLGASASAILAAGTFGGATVFGANDRIRAGIIGMRSRGNYLMRALTKVDGVEVGAICDVDEEVLEARAAEFKENVGKPVNTYGDLRDLLAADDIDVVFVAAPNHWHVLAALWACQAGKDVYVEKPMSHTIWEGRQLIAAAEQTGQIVQVGTQRRSEPQWQRLVERLKAGVIGDLYAARVIHFSPRPPVPLDPDEAPPETLDWTLWQGPAPEKPFSKKYVHYNWHWFWHYGNGEFGNNGVHYTDITNWALDKGLPVHIASEGGRYGYEDSAETPNVQSTTATFADGTLFTCEIRGRYSNDEGGIKGGNLFYGSNGYAVGSTCYDSEGKEIPDENPPENGDAVLLHLANFLNAVRTRNQNAVPAKP
ncbi:MAG: Gfo/Idh/MocA family oxidoreductase, partial [Candidatus Hydrogenedentota bacterium]